MNRDVEHIVFLVDDEESILNSLKRLFRREGYRLYTALSGTEALETLGQLGNTVTLIISDQKMPGMNGAEFLEKAKGLCPDAIRFLLTGYSEMEAIVDAVNKGEIHRYLTKPWNDDDLVMQVRQAVDQYNLKEENKRLLALTQKQNKQLYEFGKTMEKKVKERSEQVVDKNKELEFLNKELELSLLNTIRAFAALSEMHTPYLKGHGKRVSSLSVDLAKKMGMGDEEVTTIEIAAVLHDVGTIGFPGKVIEKYNENRASKEEADVYSRHPVEGQNIVAFISKLDEAGRIIRHHHEQYDGKGYPDRLSGEEIPLGARIIAVADIYDRIVYLSSKKDVYIDKYLADVNSTGDHMSQDEIIENAALFHIKHNVFSKYDPDIVKNLMEVLKEKGVKSACEKLISLEHLEEGMVLSRSVYSTNGRFLLPHETRLTGHMIQKLKEINTKTDMPGELFIVTE